MNLSKINTILLVVLIGFVSLASSCEKDPVKIPDETTGKLQITMEYFNDGAEMKWGHLIYTNEAGNEYLGYYARFFITRLTIYKGGNPTVLNKYHNYHYFDSDIVNSLTWTVVDDIEEGSYDSLAFTFGFNDEDNQSFMFVNPPEVNMVWPEELGGGYHAMQFDGKWKIGGDTLVSFNYHLGPGQIYGTPGDIIGFIDNSYIVNLPASDFAITVGNTTTVNLRMNLENWFKNPISYDHNTYGGAIMENQEAMEKVVMNGWDVFSRVQ